MKKHKSSGDDRIGKPQKPHTSEGVAYNKLFGVMRYKRFKTPNKSDEVTFESS